MAVASVTIPELPDMLSRLHGPYLVTVPTRHLMRDAGTLFRQSAARQSPKGRTKLLSRSWNVVYGGGDPPASVSLENTDPKYPMVSRGTRPHVIRARNARALFWPGAKSPVKSVFHPGTKPNDILGRVEAEVRPQITGELTTRWNQEVAARFERKTSG